MAYLFLFSNSIFKAPQQHHFRNQVLHPEHAPTGNSGLSFTTYGQMPTNQFPLDSQSHYYLAEQGLEFPSGTPLTEY